ncbi:RNase A-like domain-containing protein, partial [Geobacillus stearothermophilus]
KLHLYRTNTQTIYNQQNTNLGTSRIDLNNREDLKNATLSSNNDTVEISSTSMQMFLVAKANKFDKGWDLAKDLVDVVTDFIPGVGTVKDAYNLYKVLSNPSSTVKDVAGALLAFVPGLGDFKSIAKVTDAVKDVYKIGIKKLDDAALSIFTKNIKSIDTKKLVDFSEGRKVGRAQGHTLAKHVAQTDNDLIKRANGKEKSDATSYTNKNTAISVIDKTIKQNAEDIANWLLNTDIDTKTLLYTSKESIGKGVYRGEKNVHRDIRQAVTVLKRDPSAKEGFIILNSFPVLKWRGK